MLSNVWHFREGYPAGVWRNWGQKTGAKRVLTHEFRFKRGKRDGLAKRWGITGLLMREETFQDGCVRKTVNRTLKCTRRGGREHCVSRVLSVKCYGPATDGKCASRFKPTPCP
jgi:hypothetical protein